MAEEALLLAVMGRTLQPPFFAPAAEPPPVGGEMEDPAVLPAVAALWARPVAPATAQATAQPTDTPSASPSVASSTQRECLVLCASAALQHLMRTGRRPRIAGAPLGAAPPLEDAAVRRALEGLCRSLAASTSTPPAQQPLSTQTLLRMAAVVLRG